LVKELAAEDSSLVFDYALWHIGYELQRASKFEDALVIFRAVAEEYPDSYKAFYHLAEAYRSAGDAEHALKSCRRALELNPENTRVAELLGQLE
jgi:tetratricopeptide (TPR) repeat protein